VRDSGLAGYDRGMDDAPVTAKAPGTLLVGPAGWSYPDWAGYVYPPKKPRGFHEAEYLARYFDTIEINTSFYAPLKPAVCWKWLERVAFNRRFQFTAKLWQRFTHESGATAEDEIATHEGFDMLAGAGKLGAVLLQFPFSFHRTAPNLGYLKKLLKMFGAYPLVIEVRHGTWNHPKFFELLQRENVGFCNIDQPLIGRSLKPSERATSPVGYVRLHGRRYDTWFSDDPQSPPEERYNYLYNTAELEPWAARVRSVSEQAQSTFVITNNHFQGKAVVNALQLISILSGNKVEVPEPLRRQYPELEAIAKDQVQEPTLFPNPPR